MAQSPSDFRSDTVTRASATMRQLMAEASVGDDVLDGDPTVQRLEQAAEATQSRAEADHPLYSRQATDLPTRLGQTTGGTWTRRSLAACFGRVQWPAVRI